MNANDRYTHHNAIHKPRQSAIRRLQINALVHVITLSVQRATQYADTSIEISLAYVAISVSRHKLALSLEKKKQIKPLVLLNHALRSRIACYGHKKINCFEWPF